METQTEAPRTRRGLTPLCELAEKYGTDKLGLYTPIYDLILSSRRDRVFQVLEVGIGTPQAMKHIPKYKPGASLRMWRDYFPNAYIYGLDINKNACMEADTGLDRITLWHGDGKTLERTATVAAVGVFDLIVDDGDHDAESQRITFFNLSPLLASGGLYIIEDVDKPVAIFKEHTMFSHITPKGAGRFLLIRQEALDG